MCDNILFIHLNAQNSRKFVNAEIKFLMGVKHCS